MAKNAHALLPVPAATTLVLLLLCLSPTRSTADIDSDVVRDVEGNPLEVGSEYYILPVGPGIGLGGGIRRSPKPDEFPCPLYAIESPKEDDLGEPVKFIPEDETRTTIRVSSGVKIDSGFSAYCRDDGIWRVTLDAMNRRFVVIASGAFGIPRPWFLIQKVDIPSPIRSAYKITFVPYDDSSREGPFYQDLTVIRDFVSGVKLLALTEDAAEALHVVFIKNNKSAHNTATSK